jgi:uncharacterized protein YdeI (YjbR/CyaY-like superfamily)
MKVVFFESPSDFRKWLETGHQNCPELWVGLYRKASEKPSITYPEALDEALCFGWIDGVRKKANADAYTVRFTPRRPTSQWSAVNMKRAQELASQGRMRPAGLKAFEAAKHQSRRYFCDQRHEASFDQDAERRFRAHRKAWTFFQAQPPWYRRTAVFWVASAKKEETRQRRLAALMADSEHGMRIQPLARPSVPKRQKKVQ